MKLLKTLGMLSLALGLATAAQAQTTSIYISGSTAFRNQVFLGLSDLGLTVVGPDTKGSNSFTFIGNISTAVVKTNINTAAIGQPVNVFCTFTGSVEGINDLENNTTEVFSNNVTGSTVTHTVNIAFSDVCQNSTSFLHSTALNEVRSAADIAADNATINGYGHGGYPGSGMAVQGFCFVANHNAITSGVVSMPNANSFTANWVNNGEQMSYLDGRDADFNNYVNPVGRYNLSGTRTTALYLNGYTYAQTLQQWALSPDGSSTPGLAATDGSTPTGNQWISVGNGGYFTGANIATALNNGPDSAGPVLAYLGFHDAASLNGSAAPIFYGGQNPVVGSFLGSSTIFNIGGVQNDQYTFWSYERCYLNPNDNSDSIGTIYAPTIVGAIQQEILAAQSTAAGSQACNENQMNCYRVGNADGGPVSHF